MAPAREASLVLMVAAPGSETQPETFPSIFGLVTCALSLLLSNHVVTSLAVVSLPVQKTGVSSAAVCFHRVPLSQLKYQ